MKPNWFVAFPVRSSTLLEPLYAFRKREGLRIFHPDDLHITLAFLGALDAGQVASVRAALRLIRHAPFSVATGVLMALPSLERTNAYSLGLTQGEDTCSALMQAWHQPICASAGVHPDPRPPLPHITVARPQRSASAHLRGELWDELTAFWWPSDSILIDSVALYTWAADRKERLFTIAYEWPLG